MQDCNYIYQGTYELTLELSCCKYPPDSELEGLWNQNKEALIAYLQAAHMGNFSIHFSRTLTLFIFHASFNIHYIYVSIYKDW